MKILVTGAGGQLGAEFCHYLEGTADIEGLALARDGLDLTAGAGAIADVLAAHRPDWVVNCAAYTPVDRAESEPDVAYRVNRDAAGDLAAAVRDSGGRLLHVSTDFVFDGRRSDPYPEDATPAPLGVYGRSKHEGELAVARELPQALILRTAWVYGVHGGNFVRTMLRLAAERDELRVVDDQVGSPSWTRDIAVAMLALIRREATGIYHFTNEGVASWYDLALATVDLARESGFPVRTQRVLPIPTRDYPTPATRPHYSVLSKTRIRAELDHPIPHWRDSLKQMLEELAACESS